MVPLVEFMARGWSSTLVAHRSIGSHLVYGRSVRCWGAAHRASTDSTGPNRYGEEHRTDVTVQPLRLSPSW